MPSVTAATESNDADDDLNEWMFNVPLGTKDFPLSNECSTSRLICPVPEIAANMSASSFPVSHEARVTNVASNTNNFMLLSFELII